MRRLANRSQLANVGNAGFLYPFLGQEKQETNDLLSEVAASIGMKVQDDSKLRAQVAREQAEQIGGAAIAIHERLAKGGKLILFGNGGSATDANDGAIDCVLPPPRLSSHSSRIAFLGAREHHGGG
jgi:D-sedoheptulose 7-phosphate isomerase